MTTKKLKLGILLDSYTLFAWEYNALERIVNRNIAEFKLLILNDRNGERKHIKNGNSFIYSLFDRVDEKLFKKEPYPFALKNVTELFLNIPEIKVSPGEANGFYTLDRSDIIKIREHQLDVLIKFGFESLQCEDMNLSKYGTWFYIHNNPPGFWEVVENWPETSSALFAAGGKLALNRVLYQSYFFTYPLSPARHRSYYFWAMASFLPRQIEFLQRFGEEKFKQQLEKFDVLPRTAIKKYPPLSNFQAIKAISKIGNRLIDEFFDRFFYFDQWFLLFNFKKEISQEFGKFSLLIPPRDKFWADPHIVQMHDKYYIFIEEFCRMNNKGHISVIEMDEDGNHKEPVKILEKNYHLSYPFVLQWDGKFYMVPETGANKSIDIYQCVEFPYQWKFKQTLMENVKAVDTTLLHYNRKWWLFTGIAENEAAAPNVELFLFYTKDLFSNQWKAHPLNPIVSDVKKARAAGSIFEKDGKLFRPSQDCSKMYGYGFDLNEIVILSETGYYEKTVKSVKPDWAKRVIATHTYANQGNLTIIDALTHRFKWAKTI